MFLTSSLSRLQKEFGHISEYASNNCSHKYDLNDFDPSPPVCSLLVLGLDQLPTCSQLAYLDQKINFCSKQLVTSTENSLGLGCLNPLGAPCREFFTFNLAISVI